MNRIILYTCILLGVSSCALITHVDLSLSNKLSEGMSKSEVEAIMGPPVKTDFYDKFEEWHYCNTHSIANEYVALFFHNGRLFAKKNYSVISETKDKNGEIIITPCERCVKMGNYREYHDRRERRHSNNRHKERYNFTY